MAELIDLGGRVLEWRQVRTGQRHYELREGQRTIAGLTFLKVMGTLAEADVEGERYTFKRTGFLRPQVTIRLAGSESDIGLVRLSMAGTGTVEFSDGRKYTFHRLSFWNNRWGFSNERGDVLMTMRVRSPFVRHDGDVVLGPVGKDEHLTLLMLLGWYMVVLMAEEGEMAAMGAATTGGQ